MAEQDIINGLNAIKDAITGGNSSTTSGNKNISTSSPLDVGTITQSLLQLSSSISPVIIGFNNLTTSTTAFSETMKIAAKMPVAGGAIKTLVEGRDIVNEAGKQGLGAGSFTALNYQAAQAGMTISQYTKTILDADGRLQGFGRNASVAGENFADTVKRSLEGPVGQQMLAAGIQSEEIAKGTAIMGMATKANMNEIKSRQDLANAGAALTLQMDETARITGKSREAIAKEMEESTKNAKTQLQIGNMTEEQRMQFQLTKAKLAELGPVFTDAAANIASNTKLSQETINTLSALGPAGDTFQRAIHDGQNARTAADKQAADAALERAKSEILARTVSDEFREWTLSEIPGMTEHMLKMKSGTIAAENVQRAITEDPRYKGMDPSQAREAALAEVRQNQQLKDAQGRQLEGAVVIGELNKAAEGMRKTAVGAAGALDTLNNSLGKTPERLKPITDILNSLGDYNKTSDQNRKKIEDLKNIILPVESKPSSAPGMKPYDILPGTPLQQNKTFEQPNKLNTETQSNNQMSLPTMKDLHDVMIDVNNNIKQMLNHTQSISDSSDKAVRYASEASGSRI